MSLKDKAVHGLLWSAVERFGTQIIQFLVAIILARLLTPADYGLVGMLSIFATLTGFSTLAGFA